MKAAYHKARLRSAYLAWLNEGSDMDCGLHLAQHIRPTAFARHERNCVKHATALRELGETVPLVPGEEGFK